MSKSEWKNIGLIALVAVAVIAIVWRVLPAKFRSFVIGA